MHITKAYHRRVVTVLSGILFVLFVLLVLAIIRPELLHFTKTAIPPSRDPASASYNAPSTGLLADEEVVIVREGDEDVLALPIQKVLYEYIEVKDSCGSHYEGDCLNVRAGPGGDFPVVTKLRDNVVLKVGGKVERDGTTWIKLVFDEWLRYPERVKEDLYISSAYADVVLDEGDKTTWENGNATTTKEIVIDRSEQKLYAYENDELFAEIMISTGLELTPTPRGTFTVFKKTPSRYMQGPIPGLSDQYYDLPGVPWNLYFTHDGAVIHGAYWHESFGTPYSHGCVNLPPEEARTLYLWADLGTKVTVRD